MELLGHLGQRHFLTFVEHVLDLPGVHPPGAPRRGPDRAELPSRFLPRRDPTCAGRVRALKEQGFMGSVHMVGYPPFSASSSRPKTSSPAGASTWWYSLSGAVDLTGNIPEAYSDEEKRLMQLAIGAAAPQARRHPPYPGSQPAILRLVQLRKRTVSPERRPGSACTDRPTPRSSLTATFFAAAHRSLPHDGRSSSSATSSIRRLRLPRRCAVLRPRALLLLETDALWTGRDLEGPVEVRDLLGARKAMTKNGELVRRLHDWLERGLPQGPYSLHLSPTMACAPAPSWSAL